MDIQSKRGGDTVPNDLPEGCIAYVISLTSPKDACRLSLVNSQFRSAAESDQVWEGFIPADYREILSKSTEGTTLLRCCTPKRQLYFYLCHNPLFIDGGTKSKCFALDKPSGKMSFYLGARALSISWINNPRYWKFTCLPESRFGSAAEQIRRVSSLRIRGAINPRILSPGTYEVYLVFRMAMGNGLMKAEASVGFSGERRRFVDVRPNGVVKRGDGWSELKLGMVFIDGKEDADVNIVLRPLAAKWSGCVVVEGIEIRVHENPDL